MATDEWLTASGASIQDKGVAPDVQGRPEEGQGAPTPAKGRGLSREEIFAKDAQLRRAFDVLWGG